MFRGRRWGRWLGISVGGAVLFSAGVLVGQAHQAAHARAFGDVFCRYHIETRYFDGGAYTALTAVAAEWDDYLGEWRPALVFSPSSLPFDCERS